MRIPTRRAVLASAAALAAVLFPNTPVHASSHASLHCERGQAVCAELQDSEEAFGEGVYVGHDEPSALFYSNVPGSGNHMRYQLTLPKDPTTGPNGVPKAGQT